MGVRDFLHHEPERRATAIGVYGLLTGVIYVPASLIADALWAAHADAVFIVVARLSSAAVAALIVLRPARRQPWLSAIPSCVRRGSRVALAGWHGDAFAHNGCPRAAL